VPADFGHANELRPGYLWATGNSGETYGLVGCYDEGLAEFNLPRPLRAAAHRHPPDLPGAQPRETSAETLALTKTNWN
jgi:hypothetical protein